MHPLKDILGSLQQANGNSFTARADANCEFQLSTDEYANMGPERATVWRHQAVPAEERGPETLVTMLWACSYCNRVNIHLQEQLVWDGGRRAGVDKRLNA